jgi:hypothetical protein
MPSARGNQLVRLPRCDTAQNFYFALGECILSNMFGDLAGDQAVLDASRRERPEGVEIA